MKKKIVLQLTDLSLHARHFRPASSLEAATKKGPDGQPSGRLYENGGITVNPDGTFTMALRLPEELQKQIDAGEVEVEFVLPEGGLPIFAGKDAVEKIKQVKAKERRKLIHSGKVWRKE